VHPHWGVNRINSVDVQRTIRRLLVPPFRTAGTVTWGSGEERGVDQAVWHDWLANLPGKNRGEEEYFSISGLELVGDPRLIGLQNAHKRREKGGWGRGMIFLERKKKGPVTPNGIRGPRGGKKREEIAVRSERD